MENLLCQEKMGLSLSHYVTRSELETHIMQQAAFKDEIIQEIRRELEATLTEQLATKDHEIQELRQELTTTQLALAQLEQQFPSLPQITFTKDIQKSDSQPEIQPVSRVSEAAIDSLVQGILTDHELDLPLIPNSIEARLYRKIIRQALLSIAKMTQGIHLDLLGHQIRVILEPIPPKSESSNTG